MSLHHLATCALVLSLPLVGAIHATAPRPAAHQTAADSAATTDWPQWQGPDRNGVSKETGLLAQWPATGPSRVWSVNTIGAGYGSIAIKDDRIFVQGAAAGNRQS